MGSRVLQGSAYLDDIVIYSCSWDDHVSHLATVVDRLREEGLTVMLRKCQLGMRSCSFLGHVVGRGLVSPEQEKIAAVQETRPQTKHDIRAFLGLARYYRRFIPGFSTTATCLSDLTRTQAPATLQWTEKCEAAFQKLKDALTSQPVLTSPRLHTTICTSDRCFRCFRRCSKSTRPEGSGTDRLHSISESCSHERCRYSMIEKEYLAIVASLEHFEAYLLGHTFVVQTDHRALSFIRDMKPSNNRITRWALARQPFQFTVAYRHSMISTRLR